MKGKLVFLIPISHKISAQLLKKLGGGTGFDPGFILAQLYRKKLPKGSDEVTPLFFQYRFDFISSSGWLGLAFLAVACNNGGQRSSPASSTYQEIPYCSEVRSYSNSIRVQGKALYQYRTRWKWACGL